MLISASRRMILHPAPRSRTASSGSSPAIKIIAITPETVHWTGSHHYNAAESRSFIYWNVPFDAAKEIIHRPGRKVALRLDLLSIGSDPF